MPTQIKGALTRLTGAVRDFTVAQRTIALIGLAVLGLGVAALVTLTSRPTYTPLYSGLSAADASTIVEQLRTDAVPYELTDGGSTVLVPEEHVYDQRLKAASAGLPSESTAGYSLLDDMGVTSSEFQQSVTYKRAMEGELATTISAMTGVANASVRLAVPEETVFVSEQVAPTASVFVQPDNGVTLSSDQIQAIVHLTSASIEGMKPEDVAVVDAEGTVLSAVGVGATGSTDKQASDYEQRVQSQVQAMLDRVVGPGNATVAVAADMNYSSGERLEESFTTPEGAPALNESSTTENYEGTGGAAAGVLGPDNIAVPNGGTGEGSYTAEEATRNNAVNKVTETTVIPAGDINRQTISVALDVDAAGALDRAALTELVSSAAGIDAERGDLVTVEVLPFNTTGAEEAAAALAAAAAAEEAARQADILRTALIAGAALLAVLVVVLAVLRSRRREERESVDVGELTLLETPEDDDAPAVIEQPAPAAELPAFPEREPVDAERKRAEVEAMAGADPARTAEYLRALMDDRQPA
ncbi:flagellar basal-body MS-ring/collar protein FliF [Georgenia sp. AZ-5]|uniref:flagellar basal-body MS-ring/collar protein FliF n=1 Tax=Georgenia sp. AZ-5 TaxID=3367526 RepID=UPI003754082E